MAHACEILETDRVLTVSAFTTSIKDLLESGFPSVWLRGEISNLRRQASGHTYFNLKDENSQIAVVAFRGNNSRQTSQLKEGDQILVFGSVCLYEPRGVYQIVVQHILEDGVGALQLTFERLKQKLLSEGLFDYERKKPIPKKIRKIALITSPSGAALHDFISVLKKRFFSANIIIYPSLVQGMQAEGMLLQRFLQAQKNEEIDLIIFMRGGGSAEDLWCFNSEPLVRAVACSHVPVVSAIGHETDTVLLDFCSDIRAETPTAAAEIITSIQGKHIAALISLSNILNDRILNHLKRIRGEMKLTSVRLEKERPGFYLKKLQDYFSGLKIRLKNAHPDVVLKRGFVSVSDIVTGKSIKKSKDIEAGQELYLQFQEGSAKVRVLQVSANESFFHPEK